MLHGFSMDTPAGEIIVAVDEDGALAHLEFGDGRGADNLRDRLGDSLEPRASGPAVPIASQLEEYFAGERRHFDVELAAEGTEFQKRVWSALCEIPYGETISYGELARRLDNPKAVRAVGRANGQNPISIVVPCHRVIGADGTLTGYGGGMDRKRALLELEGTAGQLQLF